MRLSRFKEKVAVLKFIIPGPVRARLERPQPQCAPISPPSTEDLIPYSAKDLKYMWTLWDEAQRQEQPTMRYRTIYVGAVGVILTGWLLHGLSFSLLGGILMLAGASLGIWFCLKSRRHHMD
jgi:hypothetical protein